MTINISSKRVELLIGGQDWSNWIDPDSGIQIGYPEYEMGSGLLIAQGTINLSLELTTLYCQATHTIALIRANGGAVKLSQSK